MKSKHLITFLLVFHLILIFNASETMASERTGYKGLKWGSTVDEVKEKYPGLYQNKKNQSLYYFDSKSTIIEKRKFEFVDGRLAVVDETYNMKLADSKSLLAQLINIHGYSFEVSSRTDTVKGIKLPSKVRTWSDSDGTTVEYTHWLYLGKISINIHVVYLDASLNKDQDDVSDNENKKENLKVPRGYQGLKWASTLEQVKEKYPNLIKSEENIEDDYFKDLTYYGAPSNSSSVSIRWFGFWHDKLTKVIVMYQTSVNPVKLIGKLNEVYGKNTSSNTTGLRKMQAIWHGNGETDVFMSVSIPKRVTQYYKNSSLALHFTSVEVKAEYDKIKSEEDPIEF